MLCHVTFGVTFSVVAQNYDNSQELGKKKKGVLNNRKSKCVDIDI